MPFLIYTTFADKAEAENIASALLEKKLIACANIFAPHTSLYKWDGEVQSETEIAAILKTEQKHFDEIEAVIKSMHSYDTPAIIGWSADKVAPDFAKWIESEVQ